MTSARTFRVGSTLLLLVAGCAAQDPKPAAPAVFGGKGATIASPDEKPLPAADAIAVTGPCAKKSPASDMRLIEDFEDGDAKLFKAFEREGWWFTASDNTEGSTVQPRDGFKAEALSGTDATRENRFAAHLQAAGQKQWGAVWGTSLQWGTKGIRCPFNGSAFDGFRFRAKGPGSIRVSVTIPESMPKDAGGTCSEGCYDHYGKTFVLSDRWDEYLVRWDRLQQGGWGAEARFDPGRVLGLGFSAGPKELPIDFWIDDIEFIAAATPAAPANTTTATAK